MELAIKFGQAPNDNLTVSLIHKSGNWFYFKKVAKEIKNLLAYCQK